jgi:hypothetical protein
LRSTDTLTPLRPPLFACAARRPRGPSLWNLWGWCSSVVGQPDRVASRLGSILEHLGGESRAQVKDGGCVQRALQRPQPFHRKLDPCGWWDGAPPVRSFKIQEGRKIAWLERADSAEEQAGLWRGSIGGRNEVIRASENACLCGACLVLSECAVQAGHALGGFEAAIADRRTGHGGPVDGSLVMLDVDPGDGERLLRLGAHLAAHNTVSCGRLPDTSWAALSCSFSGEIFGQFCDCWTACTIREDQLVASAPDKQSNLRRTGKSFSALRALGSFGREQFAATSPAERAIIHI